VESFVVTESSGNPKATRYEPNFYKKYILPMLHDNAYTPHEAIGRATSYGLMQIMGQVAREKGFKGEFEELFDPATGLEWALRHLRHFIDKYAPSLDDAIASYNAGSPRKDANGFYYNAQYVSKIHKYLNQIKEV
jgi:soluble lytic murein transglycosylase-like protein